MKKLFAFFSFVTFFNSFCANTEIVELKRLISLYENKITSNEVKSTSPYKYVVSVESSFWSEFMSEINSVLSNLEQNFSNFSCEEQEIALVLLNRLKPHFDQATVFVNMRYVIPINIKFHKLLQSAPTNC